MTAEDTDPGRAHSGCRAHSAPGKVVGLGQGHVLGAEHHGSGIRKEVPWHSPERMGSGSLYPPTNPAAGFRDGGKRQPDHPLGLAERQQERVGRGCKRPQADVALGAGPATLCPSALLSTGSGAHASPPCGEWRGAQPFQRPHCCFLKKAAHFHSPPSPSARRDGSAPRPPAPLPKCQDSCPVCRTRLEHDWPGREIISRGEWGTPARTGRSPGVGFVLLGQRSPGPRSAPSGSVCARIHSDGGDRRGRTAQLCHGSADGAPWPLTCCLASGYGPSSWLLASAACGATPELPAQGTHNARHGVSMPLAQAMVWLEHPLMAANLSWGGQPEGNDIAPLPGSKIAPLGAAFAVVCVVGG